MVGRLNAASLIPLGLRVGAFAELGQHRIHSGPEML